MRRIGLCVCTMAMFLFSSCNSKKVYTGIKFGVNYVTHLYTLAEAGFKDEKYISRYGDSVSLEDREYLKSHSKYMSFLRKDHGPFAEQLYFIPSYFNMKTKREYEEYFKAWSQAISYKSFSPISKYARYDNQFVEMFNVDEEDWEKILSLYPIFNRIGEIYIKNIEAYQSKVWPEIKPILTKKSHALNKRIASDLISKWEQVTGYGFKGDEYRVILFYAGDNGPSFNNLSLDKNTAFYNLEEGYMLDMISHEVGIHILKPYLSHLISRFEREIPRINDDPRIYGNVSYMAFESLAAFYNRKVLERVTMDAFSSNDYYKFRDIYNRLYHENMEPVEIYEEGVKEYINLYKYHKYHQ